MLIEQRGKAGTLCQPARVGHLHCPLIVRATSEDNITAHLVHALRTLNPRHWLSDLLNTALGADRFRRQVYRNLRIEPWVRQPPYPRHLIPWDEGATEVDVCITWENPATTVYVEAKYGCGLSKDTSRNHGQFGFPADQENPSARVLGRRVRTQGGPQVRTEVRAKGGPVEGARASVGRPHQPEFVPR